MPLFNDDRSLIYPNHPGFVSGKYYASSFYSGLAGTTLGAGAVYYTYFYIPINQNFLSLAFHINIANAATGYARVAIYKLKDALPSTLVNDFGLILVNTVGFKEIQASFNLLAGWYAVAIIVNGTGASFSFANQTLSNLVGLSLLTTTTFNGLKALSSFAPFPSNAPLENVSNTISPLFWLKAA